MLISEARVGQQVTFGRRNGEKTRGEIIKVNRKSVKVRISEDRGRYSKAGQVWGIHPSLCTLENTSSSADKAFDLFEAFVRAAKANLRALEATEDLYGGLDEVFADWAKKYWTSKHNQLTS